MHICVHMIHLYMCTCTLIHVVRYAHSHASSLTDTWIQVHTSYIHITPHQTQAHTWMKIHMHVSYVMFTYMHQHTCATQARVQIAHMPAMYFHRYHM